MKRLNKSFLIVAMILCFLALIAMFLPSFTGEGGSISGYQSAFGYYAKYGYQENCRYLKPSLIIIEYALMFVALVLMVLSYFFDKLYKKPLHIALAVVLVLIGVATMLNSMFVVLGETYQTIAMHEQTITGDYSITAMSIFVRDFPSIGFGRFVTLGLLVISAVMLIITAIQNKEADEEYFNSIN